MQLTNYIKPSLLLNGNFHMSMDFHCIKWFYLLLLLLMMMKHTSLVNTGMVMKLCIPSPVVTVKIKIEKNYTSTSNEICSLCGFTWFILSRKCLILCSKLHYFNLIIIFLFVKMILNVKSAKSDDIILIVLLSLFRLI